MKCPTCGTQIDDELSLTGSQGCVVLLPLNTKEEHCVTEAAIKIWSELYPAVNMIAQLRAMQGWLLANPTRRKTKRGIDRFINAWLSKEQDKGGVPPARLTKLQRAQRAMEDAFGTQETTDHHSTGIVTDAGARNPVLTGSGRLARRHPDDDG